MTKRANKRTKNTRGKIKGKDKIPKEAKTKIIFPKFPKLPTGAKTKKYLTTIKWSKK